MDKNTERIEKEAKKGKRREVSNEVCFYSITALYMNPGKSQEQEYFQEQSAVLF